MTLAQHAINGPHQSVGETLLFANAKVESLAFIVCVCSSTNPSPPCAMPMSSLVRQSARIRPFGE